MIRKHIFALSLWPISEAMMSLGAFGCHYICLTFNETILCSYQFIGKSIKRPTSLPITGTSCPEHLQASPSTASAATASMILWFKVFFFVVAVQCIGLKCKESEYPWSIQIYLNIIDTSLLAAYLNLDPVTMDLAMQWKIYGFQPQH